MSDQEHNLHRLSPIELHIEELVLHGFSAGDRHAISDGLQLELARILTERNPYFAVTDDARLESINAGAFHLTSASRPEVIGVQVAQVLFGGLAANASGSRDNHRSDHALNKEGK